MTEVEACVPVFRAVVDARLSEDGRHWMESRCAAIMAHDDPDALITAFAVAARKLGKAPVVLELHEREELSRLGVSWAPASRVDEYVRIVFLLLGCIGRANEMAAVASSCFVAGDLDERRAVLRALPLLPEPAEYLSLAVEACRTNIEPLFRAIGCQNPYPASYFPDAAFHHLVLKALFLGIPVKSVIGLERRRSPELVRMALDFASERRAAGRPVPVDLGEVIGMPS